MEGTFSMIIVKRTWAEKEWCSLRFWRETPRAMLLQFLYNWYSLLALSAHLKVFLNIIPFWLMRTFFWIWEIYREHRIIVREIISQKNYRTDGLRNEFQFDGRSARRRGKIKKKVSRTLFWLLTCPFSLGLPQQKGVKNCPNYLG